MPALLLNLIIYMKDINNKKKGKEKMGSHLASALM
jgi:hypothetical protein